MCFQLAQCFSPSSQVLIGWMVTATFAFGSPFIVSRLKFTKYSHDNFPCKKCVLPTHRALSQDSRNIRLTIGYAHPSGMRKITDKFKKGPTLTLVDSRDDKSVFIPEWIHRFKLDVGKVRREEVKSLKPIQVKAPIPTDYPSECFLTRLNNLHNVSQPVS
ncbi:hypothetical protein TNIN_226201 [Trichonephila inaurata madagascariensis]|uniref:Uncharacterized protein n=1 Tax=Trichonephila inaurata madagascariensis TaxID=2747483 RepID=A0A8X7C8G5_9ARAC|nr:hypothetical protein TNIN_226201 [Trichonephila inaurata madagascariensis]